MKSMTFAQFVERELRAFKFLVLIVATVGVAVSVGILVSFMLAQSDQKFLNSVAPYLSVLVQSGDRPELMRFSEVVAAERGSTFWVLQEGQVFATSGAATELDRPLKTQRTVGNLFGSKFDRHFLYSQTVIAGTKSSVLIATPIKTILGTMLLAALSTALASTALIVAFGSRLNHAIQTSIAPVARLDSAIRGLADGTSSSASQKFEIEELERIRCALSETRQDLENTRDHLVEARAKELTANAYRRLIHDLHNPVAALSRLTELSYSCELDQNDREAITSSIGNLAEEVLRQISANRQSISETPSISTGADICSTVSSALATVSRAGDRAAVVGIERDIPESSIIFAHDPDLLRRAISNLVTNAIEACRSKVRLTVKNDETGVTVSVADDGAGLDPDQLTRFLQGRGRSTKGDRDAVGFASVSHIVRAHGGRLLYRKSDFNGACFEIQLKGLT